MQSIKSKFSINEGSIMNREVIFNLFRTIASSVICTSTKVVWISGLRIGITPSQLVLGMVCENE